MMIMMTMMMMGLVINSRIAVEKLPKVQSKRVNIGMQS